MRLPERYSQKVRLDQKPSPDSHLAATPDGATALADANDDTFARQLDKPASEWANVVVDELEKRNSTPTAPLGKPGARRGDQTSGRGLASAPYERLAAGIVDTTGRPGRIAPAKSWLGP